MPRIQQIGSAAARLATLSLVLSTALFLCTSPAQAWTLKTLYHFTGKEDGGNLSNLLRDDATGDLYGVTGTGGNATCYPGCGVVFRLSPQGREKVLYSFTGGRDGYNPSGLIRDSAGNLYGATDEGGHRHGCFFRSGCGVIFKLAPDGTYTVLHTFSGADGESPGDLTQDTVTGDLYGTTYFGGANGLGAVFRVGLTKKYELLHSFSGGDGAYPVGPLLRDEDGYLYGVTRMGGADCGKDHAGCGTIFKIAPDGDETVLYAFTSKRYGFPSSGLAVDKAGNLYGASGGNRGAVFMLNLGGDLEFLHKFANDGSGSGPSGNLILKPSGAILGTTGKGGPNNGGIVYQLASGGAYEILHSFTISEGVYPNGLIEDSAGNLYGTTQLDGVAPGTVFELVK